MSATPAHRGIGGAVAAAIAIAAIACGGSDKERAGNGERDPAPPPGAQATWGEPKGTPPIAVVILLHGGGWERNPKGYRQQVAIAESMTHAGYATVAVGYGPGAAGMRHVEVVYRQVRSRYPQLPICVIGVSAGGHLALMLATREPELDCVVDLAGPTDLTTLERQGSAEGARLAAAAFGAEDLARYSPIRYAGRIRADVLMVMAENDPVIPAEQGEELARVLPSAELIELPPGPAPYVHSGVAAEPLARATARQQEFVGEAVAGG